ncbi:hypothetical protein BTVI_62532 [Pitangus sulphuratus]|nr:hypothetical protein BTVI_62532 [Pitangus sulphuratus]
MVRQFCPCNPWRFMVGQKPTLQPVDDVTLEQMDVPEEGCDPMERTKVSITCNCVPDTTHTETVLDGYNEVSPKPFLLQAEQLQFSQLVFIGEMFQPADHLHDPLLDPFQQVPVLGTPQLDAVCQREKSRKKTDSANDVS